MEDGFVTFPISPSPSPCDCQGHRNPVSEEGGEEDSLALDRGETHLGRSFFVFSGAGGDRMGGAGSSFMTSSTSVVATGGERVGEVGGFMSGYAVYGDKGVGLSGKSVELSLLSVSVSVTKETGELGAPLSDMISGEDSVSGFCHGHRKPPDFGFSAVFSAAEMGGLGVGEVGGFRSSY